VKKEMKYKKVFITGISKGIGRSIAEILHSQGFAVSGTCRNPENLKDKIEGVGYFPLELSDPASVLKCKELVGETDVLINNAGQSQIGAIEEIQMSDMRYIFETNFFAAAELIHLFVPGMRARHCGMIINIGSMAGTFPLPLYSSYCSSKAAFQMLSLSIRQELKQFGIVTVHVEPDDFKTDITRGLIYREGGPYEKLAKAISDNTERKMANAGDPIVVAKLIPKIIHCQNPAPKYTIGGIGSFWVFIERFMSHRLVEKIMMKMYGLK
jgi:short-subunit dehydrogenase